MPKTNTRPAAELDAAIASLNVAALRIAEYDRLESRKPAAERMTVPLRWRIAFSSRRKAYVTARAAYLAAYPHQSERLSTIDAALGYGEPVSVTA